VPTSICSTSSSNQSSKRPLDWSGPTSRHFVTFDHGNLDLPVGKLLEAVVSRFPTRIALDDGQSQLTYRELWSLTRSLASRIVEETDPGKLVGILLPTSTSFEIAMLACFLAGRPFAPLDLHYPKHWLANVIEQSNMTAVAGHFDDLATRWLSSPSAKQIDSRAPLLGADGLANEASFAPLGPDEPAIVLFTSGSTGRPKGIVNSQRNLLRRVEQHINAGHISQDDRFLPLSSGCTIAGVRERLTALLCGATLYSVDVQRAGIGQILQIINRSGITVMYGLPALLRTLSQSDRRPRPVALRLVRVGGEAVLWSDIARLRSWLPSDCLIQIGYSSSESPIMQWFVPNNFPQQGLSAPIGYSLPGSEIDILDELDVAVKPGEVGQLVVRSPYVALGHWINGECVRDAFPACPGDPSIRIFRSGDLVRLRQDGLIDIVGRKDRQLKIQGQRVEPAELEAALLASEDVVDAAALPRELGDSISMVAYVVLRPNRPEFVLTELANLLRTTLPSQLLPKRLFAIAAIPRLPSGKLDLQALRAIDRKRQVEDAQIADVSSRNTMTAACDLTTGPVSATEDAIAAIWSRLLGKPTVGRHQDFFGLGGDSLKILQVMLEIEKTLGVQLPITMIHQCPTISSLAQAMDKNLRPAFSPLVLVKEGSGAPPFFIVHGCGGTVMELFPLAHAIRWPGCIYAIQAQGLDGQRPPKSSIAEMASLYLSVIRNVQPTGPYYISGYSYGGLVAFEMGRRLQHDGEKVAFLGLLDTSANARQWPLRVWTRQMLFRTRHHVSKLGQLPLQVKMRYLRKVLGSFRAHLHWRLNRGEERKVRYGALNLPPTLQHVRESMTEAAADYRPGYFAGAVTLYCSSALPPLKCAPYLTWKDHADHVDVVTVSGDHRTMMTGEDRMTLAHHLSNGLAKAELVSRISGSGSAVTDCRSENAGLLDRISASMEF
jgi:acyl-coenzyme A synthetase/AMP-(fatty) acid ligase/thioesterase domain-containing protein/acyl carrier protein